MKKEQKGSQETNKKDLEETIERMNETKEVQRMQFDYFKHMTILCSGLILIIAAAFIEGGLSGKTWICFAVLSLGCFSVCILSSTFVLPAPANAILYIAGMCTELMRNDKSEAYEYYDKYCGAVDQIEKHGRITKWTFFAGILFLLLFTSVNMRLNGMYFR